ncbi:GNAT family N-acetyltransferase [Fodinicola acaciae]|uniref:GNAT family N-acetyltransferase n=1 Tax=Fodinicola acaciae TaxID=2681555 RepID=UPI001651CA14|nr:GNAT family N-acetyltransferase [Fodinicola acaciae]
MTRTLRAAGRADLQEVSAVLARAFFDDPVMAWMIPDEAERRRRLPLFFRAVGRHEHLPYDGVDAILEDGAVRGAAMWKPPGHWKTSGWRTLLSAPAYMRAFGPYLRNGGVVQETMSRLHPHEPHWYLAVVGTDPAAQGGGVGTDLIRSRLEICDRDGVPAYLESSKAANVPYYERFGFKVTREIVVADGPTLWPMWRQPQ